MGKNTINRLRILIQKWKDANVPGNRIDLNKLADETLAVINGDPFLKEVCEIFLYSISITAIKDKNFDNIGNQQPNIIDRNIKRSAG